MVTHSSTSRPVQCLCMAERTGCPVLTDLWSYVLLPLVISMNNILKLLRKLEPLIRFFAKPLPPHQRQIPLHRQKCQTPQLSNIRLRRVHARGWR
jgi:hypothetical protein